MFMFRGGKTRSYVRELSLWCLRSLLCEKEKEMVLDQWISWCGPWTSSKSIFWEPSRNANLGALPWWILTVEGQELERDVFTQVCIWVTLKLQSTGNHLFNLVNRLPGTGRNLVKLYLCLLPSMKGLYSHAAILIENNPVLKESTAFKIICSKFNSPLQL